MGPSHLHVSAFRSVCFCFVCVCVCILLVSCVHMYVLLFLLNILRLFPSLGCVDPEQVGHYFRGTWNVVVCSSIRLFCVLIVCSFFFLRNFAAGL